MYQTQRRIRRQAGQVTLGQQRGERTVFKSHVGRTAGGQNTGERRTVRGIREIDRRRRVDRINRRFDRRVFWIGVGGDVEEMAALTGECVDLSGAVTGRQDSRVRSRAHLTVARVRSLHRGRSGPYRRRGEAAGSGPDRVAALAHALAVYSGPLWTVEDVVLVESRPGEGRGGGPAYETRETFTLGAGTTV